MNVENIYETFKNFSQRTDDYLGALFVNIFKEFPYCYKIYFDNDKQLQYIRTTDRFYETRLDLNYSLDMREIINGFITKKSESNDDFKDIYIVCYSATEYLVIGEYKNSHFLFDLAMPEADAHTTYMYIFGNNIDDVVDLLKGICNPVDTEANIEFGITAVDVTGSLYTSWYDYKQLDVDIDKNYNDDFKKPYEKICKIIEEDNKSSLMLFYGDPGTGKSSIIKHLIAKYKSKEFIFLDGSLLASVGQDKIMSYFLENNNTIFILEDCEKVLVNRDHYNNPVISILLNITDGIISDVLGIKLICTFNTAISQIDKALTRKGRLSLKYEFKPLAKEKASKILGHEVNKDMPLSEIYYEEDENDFSKETSKKIGF